MIELDHIELSVDVDPAPGPPGPRPPRHRLRGVRVGDAERRRQGRAPGLQDHTDHRHEDQLRQEVTHQQLSIIKVLVHVCSNSFSMFNFYLVLTCHSTVLHPFHCTCHHAIVIIDDDYLNGILRK